DVCNNLAWLLSDAAKSMDEALALAQRARRARPNDPELADTLGWIYYKMKNYSLAVDQLQFSVNNLTRPQAENYYRLGLALYGKKDIQQAQTMLKKALQTNPTFAGAADARKLLESI